MKNIKIFLSPWDAFILGVAKLCSEREKLMRLSMACWKSPKARPARRFVCLSGSAALVSSQAQPDRTKGLGPAFYNILKLGSGPAFQQQRGAHGV